VNLENSASTCGKNSDEDKSGEKGKGSSREKKRLNEGKGGGTPPGDLTNHELGCHNVGGQRRGSKDQEKGRKEKEATRGLTGGRKDVLTRCEEILNAFERAPSLL